MRKPVYENPLISRYSSKEMQRIFSPDFKFSTWRKLWIELASAERKLGLGIRASQIAQMKKHVSDINYKDAEKREREVRHDVMAHVHAFGLQCPEAKPIIHLGATSAYVGDNTDIIQLREGMELIKSRLIQVIKPLRDFSFKNRNMPCLGFTHFQPAQLTTVGKRASLWLNELLMDLEEIDFFLEKLSFRGVKGTTGTQASFMELFNNDGKKVRELDRLVSEAMGFKKTIPVTGQTYSRKADSRALSVLSAIAQSCSKFANDMRLLANLKEAEEPFAKKQIGSSAMAYKRNPMRSERICSLARYAVSLAQNTAMTASVQWFERTLDDSANKRIAVPESFLAVDSILLIYSNIVSGIVLYPEMIRRRIAGELPFMMTENIIMKGVEKGGDRQELHEIIRSLSMKAADNVKNRGKDNNLLELIEKSPELDFSAEELRRLAEPSRYTGRAAEQVEEFIKKNIDPVLRKNKKYLKIKKVQLKV
ncbi:MAG: adenylosuccinate lyase [Fibrobacterota bacterium]